MFYHESFGGSVERIQKDAGNRAGLGCPVPAVRAVHQHADAFIGHCLRHREERLTPPLDARAKNRGPFPNSYGLKCNKGELKPPPEVLLWGEPQQSNVKIQQKESASVGVNIPWR